MGKVEEINPSEVLGKRVNEYLKDVKEDTSTLMNVLKSGKKIIDLIQQYSNEYKKKVTTINTTIPVVVNGKNIAAIEISKDMTRLKELTECIYKLQGNDIKVKKNFNFKDMITNSPKMKEVIEKAKKASFSNSSVLIYAETGAVNMADENSALNCKNFESRMFNKSINEVCENDNISSFENFDLEKYMDNVEKDIIKKVLRKNDYNVSKASRELNVSRQNLQYKLRKHNIKQEKF